MTETVEKPESTEAAPPDEWISAGVGWGARATEWAYLFEPYAAPANNLVFDQLGVGPSTRHLDIACGSGFAAQVANRRGATVSGIDASEALIDIAQARTPEGDFRVGDMYALPFEKRSFDAVTSFNGIWNGCDDALRQARMVLTDDGLIGLTYWGSFERMGLLPYFMAIIEHSPPSHQTATMELGETGAVAAAMLLNTGFELLDQGTVEVINEWPDVDTAVRALAAAGPAVPAIETIGYDEFCDVLRGVVTPMFHRGGNVGLRISSELGWVSARPS